MTELNKQILDLRNGYGKALSKSQTPEEIAHVLLGVATGLMQWAKMFQTPAHKDMALMFAATILDASQRLTSDE